MKKTLLTTTMLALLAGAVALVRADDMKNMPGMSMSGMDSPSPQTNATTGSTNAPVKPYPLNYCIVSGDKFDGDMDQPVTNYYQGQQIIFCCSDCVKKFKKNPEKYMKKLHKAEKQAATDKK